MTVHHNGTYVEQKKEYTYFSKKVLNLYGERCIIVIHHKIYKCMTTTKTGLSSFTDNEIQEKIVRTENRITENEQIYKDMRKEKLDSTHDRFVQNQALGIKQEALISWYRLLDSLREEQTRRLEKKKQDALTPQAI